MHKYIIKLFALSYITKVGSFTRGANIIFSLMVLSGTLAIYNSPLQYIVYVLLFIVLYFGFVYFHFYPLTRADAKYFDASQRHQWAIYHGKKYPLAYNPLWVALVNPIVIILFLIYYLLC